MNGGGFMKRIGLVVGILFILFSFSISQAQIKPGWPKSVTIGAAPVGLSLIHI